MFEIKVSEHEKKLWAPYCWYVIHLIPLMSSWREAKENFLRNLGCVLPCPTCQDHFKSYIKQYPITSRTHLEQWTIDYHNDVNKILNKPIMSLQQVNTLLYVDCPRGDRRVIPVNHYYIRRLLEILYIYHKEENSMYLFQNFLEDLKKVFPCSRCRKDLNNLCHNRRICNYFDIINNDYCNCSKLVKLQKFKV